MTKRKSTKTKPMSSLDGLGLELVGIDTDPEAHLEAIEVSLALANIEILASIPHLFHDVRPGFILVTYDRSKDPRAPRKP